MVWLSKVGAVTTGFLLLLLLCFAGQPVWFLQARTCFLMNMLAEFIQRKVLVLNTACIEILWLQFPVFFGVYVKFQQFLRGGTCPTRLAGSNFDATLWWLWSTKTSLGRTGGGALERTNQGRKQGRTQTVARSEGHWFFVLLRQADKIKESKADDVSSVKKKSRLKNTRNA